MADDLDTLVRASKALLDEVRSRVAAGGDPDPHAESRLRALFAEARGRHEGDAAAIGRAERRALAQLERVLSVRRARSLLARKPIPSAPASAPGRRAALRTRPTITGNMEIRRERAGADHVLVWDGVAAVAAWEIRFSERETARDDYAVKEERILPTGVTRVEVPFARGSLRVHVLGRSRDGRLLRRAVISALTPESWDARWQRRASAS